MPRGGAGAGRDWERVTHYLRETAVSPSGHKEATYTEGSTYWAYTSDVKADKKLAYGIMNMIVETDIHIRGFPVIDPLDRFLINTTGNFCECKGVKLDYETGETVVTV